jgi:actin-related protein 8
MILTKLKIPFNEIKNFSCVIIIPDIFIRKHIKYLTYRLFKGMGFKRIYLHIESVLACFGTAVSSACVVDIGHEKINICCVDEGIIIPQTLIRKNYGLKYLSKSLCKIFAERVNDKEIGEIKFAEEADLNQIDKVK